MSLPKNERMLIQYRDACLSAIEQVFKDHIYPIRKELALIENAIRMAKHETDGRKGLEKRMKKLIEQKNATEQELDKCERQKDQLSAEIDRLKSKIKALDEHIEGKRFTGKFKVYCQQCGHMANLERDKQITVCTKCHGRHSLTLTGNPDLQPLCSFWATRRKGWARQDSDRCLAEFIRFHGYLDEWLDIEGRFNSPEPLKKFDDANQFVMGYLFAGLFDRNDSIELLRRESLVLTFKLAEKIANRYLGVA